MYIKVPTLLFLFALIFSRYRPCWGNEAAAVDWAQWRGPEQNGDSRERDLPDHWSPDPQAADNNLIWKAPYGGRSTPLVFNGRVYLINGVGDGVTQQERVMCFDAETGKMLHEYVFNVFFTDIVAVRLGWDNLAGDPETGNIYAHGTGGLFFCFDKDLKVLWSRSLTEEFGRISGYGGRITTPTVDGDLVIIGMLNASWGELARGGQRFVAMNKRTGAIVWWTSTGFQPKDSYYSVPVVKVINGERLLISGGGDGGVHAFRVRTGEKVWSYIFCTGSVNCSPVVEGNLIYIGHGEENFDTNKLGRVVCLDGSKIKEGKPTVVWDKPGIKVKYVSPILHDGRLYVCDEVAMMYCLDAKDGKLLWRHKYGRNSKGSPVWADGKIYVAEVNSRFHILKPDDTKCEDLHTQFFPSPDRLSDVEINGSPAVYKGRIYFMTSAELICIGKKDHTAPADAIPAEPKENPIDPDAKPAYLQIVPADVTLVPGESTEFLARLFNNHGQLLKEVKNPEWSVAAMLPPPAPPGETKPSKEPPAGTEKKPPTKTPLGEAVKPMPPTTPAAGPPPPPLKGDINAEGKLMVDKAMPGQFGGVIAKAEGLNGRARVRVVPVLPYKQDFEKVPETRTPGGWVNTQGKFAVRQKGDSKVLVKLAVIPSPLVARANAYISAPSLNNYTVQADLMGTRKGGDVCDMGILNSRYTFFLDGNKQLLRLVSWDALPRIDKTVAWNWETEVWYRMKMTVQYHGDKALILGKIWKRDAPEPQDWTLSVEDPIPNREGSPGLYGNATGIEENSPGTEIFYDNVVITPNKNGETKEQKAASK